MNFLSRYRGGRTSLVWWNRLLTRSTLSMEKLLLSVTINWR